MKAVEKNETRKMFHVKQSSDGKSTGLLGAYAFLAVVCFGAAGFGLGFAGEYAFVGVVEEGLITGLLFGLLVRHFADRTVHGHVSIAARIKRRSQLAQLPQPVHRNAFDASFPWRAALLTALVFALCHLAHPWKLPLAFAFSLCMIWIYRRTGSLWWPVCAHTAFDICWFGLIGLP